jgi:hypothetical protein
MQANCTALGNVNWAVLNGTADMGVCHVRNMCSMEEQNLAMSCGKTVCLLLRALLTG